jgi:hypothetical protein
MFKAIQLSKTAIFEESGRDGSHLATLLFFPVGHGAGNFRHYTITILLF